MKPDELLAALRGVANKGADSEHMPAVAAWLKGHLAAIPPGDRWPTRQLYAHLEGAGVNVSAKLLGQALWRLRKTDALAGCWEQDQRRRHMGHPLVVWQRPAAAPIDERIF